MFDGCRLMDQSLDFSSCDREPIHVPGAIQPHGILLVLDPADLVVVQLAGDVASRFDREPADLLGRPLAGLCARLAGCAQAFRDAGSAAGYLGSWAIAGSGPLDVAVHRADGRLILEFEPGPEVELSGPASLANVEEAARCFERARDRHELYRQAAIVFRQLTGFDRVMLYRFLDDGAGAVVAEDQADGLHSFLNHRFPASDIPKQARALYARNLIRVIPDAGYVPAPLLGMEGSTGPLDMTCCALRSVSPVHLQYLRNMGVAASASVSIVIDGTLWGLVACHHMQPRFLPYGARAAARVLARMLARQIAAQEEAERSRQRLRLRAMEDDFLSGLHAAQRVEDGLAQEPARLMNLVSADGVAICHGRMIVRHGHCPDQGEVGLVRDWVLSQESAGPFASDSLGRQFPPAQAFAQTGAGLLAVVLNRQEPFAILWFRAEEPEVLSWAGNPHKAAEPGGAAQLTPRASFDLWQETVRGNARSWTLVETETAARLRTRLVELRQSKQLAVLNAQLRVTVQEKDTLLGQQDSLLQQKDVLLGEVNHRVQNSLQLVSSFLSLQMRGITDERVLTQLEEARRRLMAVALVHRRLYRSDQVQSVEMGRYLEELRGELVESLGSDWERHIRVRADTISVPTDQAVSLGLILTELVVNAAKYAYGGAPGPIDIELKEGAGRTLALVVADQGIGEATSTGTGFGVKMIRALSAQWHGGIEHQDDQPGRRVTVSVRAA